MRRNYAVDSRAGGKYVTDKVKYVGNCGGILLISNMERVMEDLYRSTANRHDSLRCLYQDAH